MSTLDWPELNGLLLLPDSLKAGFSTDTVAVSSGRTVEPEIRKRGESGNLGPPGVRWFPRDKSVDGSSLFFIVWPFLFPLGLEVKYYGRC